MKCFIAILFVICVFSSFTSQVDAQINPSVIVNFAKDIWNLIEGNKPVVNIQTDFANGLPMGVNSSRELENWVSPPTTIEGSNIFYLWENETPLVTFDWTLEFTYGGDYNGVGKYLDDITISPTTVSVVEFFQLSVVTHIAQPINVGNDTHPIAGIQVDMEYKISAIFKTIEGAITYFVQGDGQWKCVNNCNQTTYLN